MPEGLRLQCPLGQHMLLFACRYMYMFIGMQERARARAGRRGRAGRKEGQGGWMRREGKRKGRERGETQSDKERERERERERGPSLTPHSASHLPKTRRSGTRHQGETSRGGIRRSQEEPRRSGTRRHQQEARRSSIRRHQQEARGSHRSARRSDSDACGRCVCCFGLRGDVR